MISLRRSIVRLLIYGATALAYHSFVWPTIAKAKSDDDQSVKFEWNAVAEQANIVRSQLVYQGKETEQADGRGIPIIAVFAGIALLSNLAKAILALQRQITYGGVVIDARTTPVKITYDKALDAGVIIIVTERGVQSIERDQKANVAALVAGLKSGTK